MSAEIELQLETANTDSEKKGALNFFKMVFVKIGVLPFLLIIAIIVFAVTSDNFLTSRNLSSVVRQSSFLILVSVGQMFVLLTGGFDLSVGTIVALTSVVSATAMAILHTIMPDSVWLVITLGCFAGILAGSFVGVINGLGVSLLNVSPFMMTLGISSVGFGVALYMTGGTPVYGMPPEFGNIFGYGKFLGIPAPVFIGGVLICMLYFLLNWTRLGRYFYAVGGNTKAASLSGINTGLVKFLAYLICAATTAIAGLLLTARLDTGEANIGSAMPLESIAACVIAGVSLRGGHGRLENVVLGALFIGLVQNGMNLARVESYLQTVVIGLLLILAVIADQLRIRVMKSLYN
ncbi:ABC transporter permease [Cocleimonas flava]|uniref:Monosaccharide ABC transporter membrane protein (CUT2 family) n=2 Tax=Thiotrichaceae TaxID=135617 RepID=A0A4V2P8B4_9GAMM|nr:monosaccharide ABC transporter membrane protein (CUT2 family) [Cocleimonas flava]